MEDLNSNCFFDTGDHDDYDAVVVGSGYGGSVAACRMSMAGFKVCLLEKGRKYEARDFPTDSVNIWSAVRVENRNLGLTFGPQDALFQVHIQDDSLAATACGLGGGSLVNAGVMLSTPVRARRDPKWPKAWEKDWERNEAAASEMLRIQSVPTNFQNSKIMQQVMDQEEYDKNTHASMKLSMNFDMEQQISENLRSEETGNCLACGNCLSGCPYNAKYSTDKTYLVSAIHAGCTIKTESEVQYVVRSDVRSPRRWLVFVNEFDYIACDVVILSAGVLGTTKILFQSQSRGLSVSKKLGSGLSCNGNNVAYVAQSSAPSNSIALNRKHLSKIPFQDRPGPSISSSYISSSGFTIQSAVLPTAYPCFLFKGITTYGWQWSAMLLHDMIDRVKSIIGLKSSQSMVLNVMGYDESNGKLTFEKETNKIYFHPPHDPLLPKKIKAFEKIGKKLGGILFMSRYRSTSVHLLGGCIVSSDVSTGVCNSNGQVFDNTSVDGVHNGLYICDASMIPCSVGVNPCLTIAAAAEHVSRYVVKDAANLARKNHEKRGEVDEMGSKKSVESDVMIQETMRGQIDGMLCAAHLKMRCELMSSEEAGNWYPNLGGKVGGYVRCRAIEKDDMHIIHGEFDLCGTDIRTPYTQYMRYRLLLAASSGSRYILEGRKIMNPYLLALYAWRESTTLNVTLRRITGEETKIMKGKLYISLPELVKTMCTLKGVSRRKFIFLFLESLFRTYILQMPHGIHISYTTLEVVQGNYPISTVHKIKTEDDCTINCQHWQCSQLIQERKLYPVLLINGYSTDSYCLPTEPNDLVRTLLKEGRDVWLLHTRLHPSNSPNCCSIEDIGRIDIPSGKIAINKIIEFYEESVKVHIVAHCVGGLAVHISLMGGHFSAKYVASLSCTNSSMFFTLTTSSLVKMWLPLIPISMAILGKNKTLPLLQTSATNFRHHLLKSIARIIPRYERCTYDECEVFSGIFGNTFWHENLSHTTHYWMNKEYLTRLPMAAFPHLRKICNAGFIVDSNGNNSYLIHPERMTVPTLYISGGRTLLVTPETSFLANKYMKLHQPCYRHERVVVDGFGHSDLLIGEKSYEKVFHHIMRHIELAEEEGGSLRKTVEYECMKGALEWSADPNEDRGSTGSWILPSIAIFLLVFVLKLFVFSGFS